MNAKYSIIVPIYNAEKYLEECLESIIRQTYKNFEVILIDDGSTDKSEDIYSKYVKNDQRFKKIKKDNEGVSSTRNLGLSKASGKYIIFVDSDDYCDKNMLEKIDQRLEEDIDIVSFGYFKKYKNVVSKIKPGIIEKSEDYELSIYDGEEILGYLWNKVFSNEIIKSNKIRFNKDIHYSEDLIFVTEYFKFVKKFLIIEDCLYFYRMRKNSSTFNFYNEKSITSLDAYEYLYNRCDDENIKRIIQHKYLKNYYRLKKIIKNKKIYNIREDFIAAEKGIVNNLSLKEKILFNIIKYINPMYIFIKKIKELKYKLYY